MGEESLSSMVTRGELAALMQQLHNQGLSIDPIELWTDSNGDERFKKVQDEASYNTEEIARLNQKIRDLEETVKGLERAVVSLQKGDAGRAKGSPMPSMPGTPKAQRTERSSMGSRNSVGSRRALRLQTPKEIESGVQAFQDSSQKMSDEFQAENSSDMEKLKRRLDDLGDCDQYLMNCMGGLAQEMNSNKAQALQAVQEGTKLEMESMKNWVVDELTKLRGQEKVIMGAQEHVWRRIDEVSVGLSSVDEKLQSHTHPDIDHFVKSQIKALAEQVERALRSTVQEGLQSKMAHSDRQLGALARSHEKLNRTVEELRSGLGMAGNAPYRPAVQRKSSNAIVSSSGLPKGGGFFPSIAASQPEAWRSNKPQQVPPGKMQLGSGAKPQKKSEQSPSYRKASPSQVEMAKGGLMAEQSSFAGWMNEGTVMEDASQAEIQFQEGIPDLDSTHDVS